MLLSVYGSFEFMFFFFKQKTAYEMRISDWSSDVCSSDLLARRGDGGLQCRFCPGLWHDRDFGDGRGAAARRPWAGQAASARRRGQAARRRRDRDLRCLGRENRSEEHTSELQSLMRISYAVFCLKKKK